MNSRRSFFKKMGLLFLLTMYPLRVIIKKKDKIYWILKKSD